MYPAPSDAGRDHIIHVCIDTRPLYSDHRQRGIGTYVSVLVTQLEQFQHCYDALGRVRISYLAPAHGSGGMPANIARQPAAARDAGGIAVATATLPRRGMGLSNGCNGRHPVTWLGEADCKTDYDIYHATTLEGITFSATYKTVATLYDLIPLHMADWRVWARHPAEQLAYLRQLRLLTRVDHVIAISEATKRDACRLLGIPAERVSVILPALDPARAYVPSAEQMDAMRSALGVRGPYFLAVASSDRHKNLAHVVEAFAAFHADTSVAAGYRLYLVGTWIGREARRILALIRRWGLGDVTQRLPWVPLEHMASLYHGATALVFPSLIEGFGLPVLEAMACGTAVITSNRSSLPEVAGEAALYVAPEQVAEIAAAMRAVATRPELRAELVSRGLARAQQFSPERAARQTIAVYRSLGEGG